MEVDDLGIVSRVGLVNAMNNIHPATALNSQTLTNAAAIPIKDLRQAGLCIAEFGERDSLWTRSKISLKAKGFMHASKSGLQNETLSEAKKGCRVQRTTRQARQAR